MEYKYGYLPMAAIMSVTLVMTILSIVAVLAVAIKVAIFIWGL